MREQYVLKQFGPEEAMQSTDEPLRPSKRMKEWSRAAARGFNAPPPTEEETKRQLTTCIEMNGTLLEVFPETGSPDPRVQEEPVGTFMFFDGLVNLGRQTLVDATMIAEVTVQPAHKRRGIFRQMITTSLESARSSGSPIALLTASSGALYGRFGFTVVASYTAGRLSPQPSSRLRPAAAEAAAGLGRVEPVGLDWLMPRAEAIYDQFLERYRCATTRSSSYLPELYCLPNAPMPSPRYQAIVHVASDGELDGYAIYSVHKETIMRVEEVVAGSSGVEIALWNHLTSIELIEALYYAHFPTPPTLSMAFEDFRALQVTGAKDALWARVVNAPAALEQRPYPTHASTVAPILAIRVEDPLGFATGTFVLTFESGEARVVEDAAATPQLELSVDALTAIVFGAVSPSQLAAMGQLSYNPETTNGDYWAEGFLSFVDELFAPIGEAAFLAEF